MNILWALVIMVPVAALALWANLGRPPRIVLIILSGPGLALCGLFITAAIATVIWSFFA
jgi:hypothetical protein